jgi:two-component system, NtrC family, response regulator PilR
MREFLQLLFERMGHEVHLAKDVASALKAVEDTVPDLVFSDLRLTDGTGMDVLKFITEKLPDVQVIIMTAFGTAQNAVEAMRLGAYDYIIKPVKVDEIEALTQKALEKLTLIQENRTLRSQLQDTSGVRRIIGTSPQMKRIADLIERIAPAKTTVLIQGESGTGKELVARAIHNSSGRQPFVPVNCGAIPETLIEAELFGHVAGAFTGASKTRPGLFESAQGGTIFLDEVAELPLAMQVKLLRVLQERMIRRVGDDQERTIDVRVIAATNRNLQNLVKEEQFREDLFYRLNVVQINIPPLRERTEDIPNIARGFVLKYAHEQNKEIEELSADAVRALAVYDFPGNVRELENFMERGVALATSKVIRLEDLPDEIRACKLPTQTGLLTLPANGLDLEATLEQLEKRLMEEALARTGGIKTQAAKLLGLSFRSMRYRMQKLGFSASDDNDEVQAD